MDKHLSSLLTHGFPLLLPVMVAWQALQFHDFENDYPDLNNIEKFLTLTRHIKYFKYFNGKKKMVTFWGAIKLYFQINMTKALILNVMPDMIVVKYVNFEYIVFYYEI